MANMENRPRKNGRTAYLLRWVDKQTGERMSHRFDDEHEARRMLMVLKTHDHDTERALENVRKHYQSAYTVADMVSDHTESVPLRHGPGGCCPSRSGSRAMISAP